MNRFTKRLFSTLLLPLLLLSSASILANADKTVITHALQEEIQSKDQSGKIKINIRLSEVYKNERMQQKLTGVTNKEERRALVVSELKSFSQLSQEDLLNFLTQKQNNALVAEIKPLWIVNVVTCYATPEVIAELSTFPGVVRIDHDRVQKVIESGMIKTPDNPADKTKIGDGDIDIAWNVSLINAPEVWEQGFEGEDIIVAVLDTGVNGDHVDLAGRMWQHPDYPNHGYNFVDDNFDTSDNHSHGTHCAGTVAGNGSAGDLTGIAPRATIMALKVLDSGGGGTESGVWSAIEFSVENGAHVMSLSLGWQHSWDPDRSAWRTAMVNALNAGVVAAVAAGNEGSGNAPSNVRTPGDCPPPWTNPDQLTTGGNSAVVSVGSTTSTDNLSGFSSTGPVTWQNVAPYFDYSYQPGQGLITPDVSAPGSDILSLSNTSNTGYTTKSGTSMATPAVAGLMALMLSKNPNLSPEEISQILEESAISFSDIKSNTFGAGRVDALAAVNATPYMGVIYHNHAFDEISGNDDGKLNPGEVMAIDVDFFNPTDSVFQDVQVTLRANSPYIEMVDSTEVLGAFDPQETRSFEDLFEFIISDTIPGDHQILFEMFAFENETHSSVWRSFFEADAYAPFLVFENLTVDDSAFGNDNDRLDPGETAEIIVELVNKGFIVSDLIVADYESLDNFITIQTVEELSFEGLEPSEIQTFSFIVSASEDTPLESPADLLFTAESGLYTFKTTTTILVGEAPVYDNGNIPTTYNENPSVSSFSGDPGVMTVSLPEGAVITGVDVEYQMTSQSGAWMSEQRSFIKCVSDGGTSEKDIAAGPSSNNAGSHFYERDGLTIANNVTGGGDVVFELHAFRTWGGSGTSSNYAYVDNNSWKVIVHYEVQKYDVTFRFINQFGEAVKDASVEVAAQSGITDENGEIVFTLTKGTHIMNVGAHNHYDLDFHPVEVTDEGIIEMTMERKLIAWFNVQNSLGETVENAVITVDGQTIEGLMKDELVSGLYAYTVEAENHESKSSSFFVTDHDLELMVIMNPYFNASFDIRDIWDNELTDAEITINENTFNESVISELIPGEYSYTITRDHFYDYKGELLVIDRDIDVSVVMQPDGTSVRETITEDEIRIYPNPASDEVFIQIGLPNDRHHLSLVTITGQVLYHATTDGTDLYKLDLGDINPGIYFIRVQSENKNIIEKLIIE